MIRKLIFAVLLLIGFSPTIVHAQVAGMGVSGCGTPLTQLKPGIPAWLQVDTGTGSLCISGTISATTAGFNYVTTGTPLAVTTSSATSTAFASSTSVVATNVGTANAAYCAPGAGPATTSSQYIAPGSWFDFYAAGGITQISCITSSSTTTVNISAGTGLAAGAGGGGGGGGTVIQGAAAVSGPWIVTPWIAGAVNSATNGLYVNLLQSNLANASGNPIFAQITGGAATMGAVTQASGPWTFNLTQVNGAGVVTAASGIQKVGISGAGGATMDFVGQNAAQPANSLLTGCEYNSPPTTISAGNASPCQSDSAGNHLVKVNAALPAGTNAIGSITNTSFSSPFTGIIASAVPVNGAYLAGVNGSGNLTGLSTDNAGNLNINLVNGGVPGYNPGDTTDANGHTIYVQGAPSGNNLPVSVLAPVGLGTSAANAVAVDIISGSISAATGFSATVTGVPFTATNVGVTSASFTSSTEVVVTNVGNTNAAYCAPGGSASTSSQYIAPNGGWFAFYAGGGITQITCITSASTTTINIVAGAGLPTGVNPGGTLATVTSNQGTAAGSGPWIVTPWIGGAVNSATNGNYVDILQGNAVLTAANPIFAAQTALVSATQTALHADPCQTQDWMYATINFNTATTSTVVTGTASKKTYVCSMFLFVPSAINIGVIEGTTATCGSGTAGVIGGTTAATGINFAANQGVVLGGAGHPAFATATNADNLCFAFSSASQVSGNIAYVQQ